METEEKEAEAEEGGWEWIKEESGWSEELEKTQREKEGGRG